MQESISAGVKIGLMRLNPFEFSEAVMVAKCVPIDGVQTVIRQECSQIRQEFFAA